MFQTQGCFQREAFQEDLVSLPLLDNSSVSVTVQHWCDDTLLAAVLIFSYCSLIWRVTKCFMFLSADFWQEDLKLHSVNFCNIFVNDTSQTVEQQITVAHCSVDKTTLTIMEVLLTLTGVNNARSHNQQLQRDAFSSPFIKNMSALMHNAVDKYLCSGSVQWWCKHLLQQQLWKEPLLARHTSEVIFNFHGMLSASTDQNACRCSLISCTYRAKSTKGLRCFCDC